jgi:hypothetical protein
MEFVQLMEEGVFDECGRFGGKSWMTFCIHREAAFIIAVIGYGKQPMPSLSNFV